MSTLNHINFFSDVTQMSWCGLGHSGIPAIFNHEQNLTEHWNIVEAAILESPELYKRAEYYVRNKTLGVRLL